MTTKHVPPRLWARHTLSLLGLSAALLGCAGAASASPLIVYVATNGSDSNDGSQAHPFLTIHKAIQDSGNGGTIEIADGTYTGPGNVDLDTNGTSLTIQSEHGPASTIIDCSGSSSVDHRGISVISGETVSLTGLTIKNGYESSDYGGAVYAVNSSVALGHCVLTGNTAQGGGAFFNNNYNTSGAQSLTDCVIANNTALSGNGGGVYSANASNSLMSFARCIISNNTAGGNGGGIFNTTDTSNTEISECTISGNSAGGMGGGVYTKSYSGSAQVGNCIVSGNSASDGGGLVVWAIGQGSTSQVNCLISGNSAQTSGGGLFVYADTNYTYNTHGSNFVTNCTISSNTLASSGMGNGIVVHNNSPSTSISFTNCIVYGDTGGVGEISSPDTYTVINCDVQGSAAGLDPKFVSTTDFHLQPTSPILGAGTSTGAPATDLDGTSRPNPPSIGAYEVGAAPATLTSIAITFASILTVGATDQLTATATYSDGTTADVTGQVQWTTDDPAKATVDASGLATAVGAGPINITATYVNALTANVTSTVNVSVAAAPVTPPAVSGYQALWSKADGGFSVWDVALGGAFAPHDFDAVPGYTAQAVADTPDGHVHILLTAANGAVQFDEANLSALTRFHNTATALSYGPFNGWTAKSIAAGPDGVLRVLWTRTDGQMSLWKLHANGTYDHAEYGPYAGWTARLMSVAHDNTVRIVWTKTDGQMSFWVMNAQGGYAHAEYGAYPGWTPTALTTSAAGQNLVSWTHAADGKLSLWALQDSGQFSFVNFGPFAGWTARSLTVGADSTLHVGWTQAGGAASLWDLSGSAFQFSVYGPYSAWHLQGLAAAP